MPKSVFVSYKWEDKKWVAKLKSWADKNLLGENVRITVERADYRMEGKAKIRQELKLMIQGASCVLFLIGQDSHNRPWVDYEVDLANQYRKKIVLVRIPETTGKPPVKLRKYAIQIFDPNSLKDKI